MKKPSIFISTLILTLSSLAFPQSILAASCSSDKISTVLGCIPSDPATFAFWILQQAVIMGSGIAFLLSLFGGISIILASGDPEKINQGKQIISSAVSGFLFIFFSVLLLRLIGYDILQLPGFGN